MIVVRSEKTSRSAPRVASSLARACLLLPAMWAFTTSAQAVGTLGADAPAPPLKSAATPDPEPPHVITSSCAQPVYPPDAFAAGQTGSVVLSIRVSASGAAEKVDVEKSSGNPQLDAAAATGMSQCRFSPATQFGQPVATTTSLKYTFRIDNSTPEEIAAQKKMTAVIAVQGMRKRIDAITQRCGLLQGLVSGNAKAAAKQWHERNDATLKKSEKLKESLFADFRARSKETPKKLDEQVAKSRQAIDSVTNRGAEAEINALETSGDQKDEYCQVFNSQTVGGEYDLAKVYPEFVTEIDEAGKPAAKK